MKISRPRVIVLLMLVAAVVACGGLPPTRYYVLEPRKGNPAASLPAPAGEGLVIGVETFHVDPPYDQDRIVYRVGDGSPEIGFYAYHRWAAPLARMLPGVVAAELHGMLGVKTIEPVAPGREYAAYLGGRVLAIEEIDTPQGQQARVRLTLTLRLKDGTELWSETFASETATRTEDVAEVVDKMSAALQRVLGEARVKLPLALRNLP